MNTRASVTAVLGAAVLVLAGCTGGDDTAPTTTPAIVSTTTSVVPVTLPPDLTADYVRAVADDTIDPIQVAVAGSDADRYLHLRRTAARVLGRTLTAQPGAFGHRLCEDTVCAVLADFVAQPGNALVESFSVDEQPIAGRISGGGSLADADGAASRVDVAYRTNAGQLVVVLTTTNSSEADIELFAFAAVYRSLDGGGGVEAAGSWGEIQIAPGASGTQLLVFDTDQLGGRIGMRGLRGDGLDIELDIAVPSA